jgi:hypothetical protein
MSLIEDEAKATRLARAIAADIELYNEAAITAGTDLTPQIQEGRELFRSRVVPAFHAVFEDVIGKSRVMQRPPPTTAASPLTSRPTIGLGDVAPAGQRPARTILFLVIAVAAVAIGAAAFLLGAR